MKTLVISVGGSLVVPKRIDTAFLKQFRKIILDFVNKGNRVVIVAGGGSTNKDYNSAAKNVLKISDVDLDWLGISCTKLNAELLRVIFSKEAYKEIVSNPNRKINTKKRIIIGSGWKPGYSSDNDAVMWAKNIGTDTVVNMTNIDYIYDRDPKKSRNAKKFENLSWNEYLKIIGEKWTPRMNVPFDPVAAKKARRNNIRVVIMNGRNPNNLKDFMSGKKFKGTVVK